MSWTGTVTGRRIEFNALDPAEFTIEDIAQGLSFQTRFNGQTIEPYTIAQHSILCAWYIRKAGYPGYALEALFHDAAEAYTGDCCRPLKQDLGTAWSDIEDAIMSSIAIQFRLHYTDHCCELIKEIDEKLLMTEKRDLQPAACEWGWGQEIEPYKESIYAWPLHHARDSFLKNFKELWKIRYPNNTGVGIDR